MIVWHHGASCLPTEVNGVNMAVWAIAREQARLGLDVTLLLNGKPPEETLRFAAEHRIRLAPDCGSPWRYGARSLRRRRDRPLPDVLHMHSVFIPHQASLASSCVKQGLPYVVTPHGGLAPHVLSRGWLKKRIYMDLIERHRLLGASAITVVLPGEQSDVQAVVPILEGTFHWVPNPVDLEPLRVLRWQARRDGSPRRALFLGRFDVEVKGLDILFEVARLLPEVEFHLYGVPDPRSQVRLKALLSQASGNIRLHGPVYGLRKLEVLLQADLYVQMSRCEAFGVSIAEAMAVGLPCAVSEPMHFAQVFREHELGVVLPMSATAAADILQAQLARPEALAEVSSRARKFAHSQFAPQDVCRRYQQIYEQIAGIEQPMAEQEVLTERDLEGDIPAPHPAAHIEPKI